MDLGRTVHGVDVDVDAVVVFVGVLVGANTDEGSVLRQLSTR